MLFNHFPGKIFFLVIAMEQINLFYFCAIFAFERIETRSHRMKIVRNNLKSRKAINISQLASCIFGHSRPVSSFLLPFIRVLFIYFFFTQLYFTISQLNIYECSCEASRCKCFDIFRALEKLCIKMADH